MLRIILLALAFIALQAHARETKNLAVQETGSAAKRVALVIGNDHYSTVTPLKNAVADARSMAAALEHAGFDVTLKTDANLSSMKLAVRQFKAKLSGGDEAVFFYSGHGVQLGAANYLLPVDITSDNEEQVKDDAIPLQRLLDDLQDQKAKFALAIIDACRDNPFKGSGRSIGGTRGLAPTSAANGQMVIFSAGNGQQALDKLGDNDHDENGIFTRVFLQEMQKPGVEVHQVLRNVRSRVVAMAKSVNHDQMPALYDQVEGDFHFYQGSAEDTQVASLAPVPARDKTKGEIEDDYWAAIKDSNDLSSFEQYRQVYPEGRYLNTASLKITQLKITQLKKQAQETAPVTAPGSTDGETDLWTEAQKGNSKDDYDAYLTQYPKGKYVALAKSRIKKIQDDAQAAAEQQEQQAWQAAQDENSEASYTRYLKGYPNGRYVGLAKEARGPAYVSQGGLTWMPVTFQKTWAEANRYCVTTTIRGQSGWRLPTNDELRALYASGAMKGQGWVLSGTWTMTQVPDNWTDRTVRGNHFILSLSMGQVAPGIDTYPDYVTIPVYPWVTCVR